MITASGLPDEGSNYTLTCTVHGDQSLPSTNESFQWDKIGSNVSFSQELTLPFIPLLYDDEGEYRCTVNITSPHLTGIHTVVEEKNLSVNRKSINAHIGSIFFFVPPPPSNF